MNYTFTCNEVRFLLNIRDLKIAVYAKRLTVVSSFVIKSKSSTELFMRYDLFKGSKMLHYKKTPCMITEKLSQMGNS